MQPGCRRQAALGQECSSLEQSPCNESLSPVIGWGNNQLDFQTKQGRHAGMSHCCSFAKALPFSECQKLKLRAPNSIWLGASARTDLGEAGFLSCKGLK